MTVSTSRSAPPIIGLSKIACSYLYSILFLTGWISLQVSAPLTLMANGRNAGMKKMGSLVDKILLRNF